MARNTSTVYLGFEDEPINEKNRHFVDYTTNKVGGQPIWPASEISITICPICGLRRPLILQIYAPLDKSPLHRMLYLFACVNAACSTQSRGWQCVRVQHLDRQSGGGGDSPLAATAKTIRPKKAPSNINWCSGADDWGDADFGDSDVGAIGGADGLAAVTLPAVTSVDLGLDVLMCGDADANCNDEPNGNVVNCAAGPAASRNDNCMSDDEDDDDDDDDDTDDHSPSLEDDPLSAIGQLTLESTANKRDDANDDRNNANNDNAADVKDAAAAAGDVMGGGAMGRLHSPNAASAEIECSEESELVMIDVPVVPKRDLIAMLKQTKAVPSDPGKIMLRGFYVAVEREERHRTAAAAASVGGGYGGIDEHVRELLHEYQIRDEKLHTSPGSPGAVGELAAGGGVAEAEEKYENGVPMHGDVMFHNFVSTIQENPGQILRYSRDTMPLLIAPLPETMHELPPCEHCAGPTLCELQLLPTIIPLLRFAGNGEAAPLEFGNVMVLTCRSNCWDTPDRMRTEQILVQAEN